MPAASREAARRRYARALLATYDRATDDQRAYGADWYGAAYDIAADIAADYAPHVTPEQVAGAIAALSPRNKWHSNVADARALTDWYFADESTGHRPLWHLKRELSAFGAQVDKAVDCLGADDPLTILRGPKERAFYLNIIGHTDWVTVDVWMARAASRGAIDSPSRGQYEDMARATRRAARAVGAAPRDFQAAVWLVARETIGHEGRRPDKTQTCAARVRAAA